MAPHGHSLSLICDPAKFGLWALLGHAVFRAQATGLMVVSRSLCGLNKP